MSAADTPVLGPSALPPPSAGDIPLETEPLLFFHPLLAGETIPGRVQPVVGTPLLEEEPATWLELAP